MLDFFKPTALKSDGKLKGLLIVVLVVLAEFKLCNAYGRRSKKEASSPEKSSSIFLLLLSS
jgi:hypothetical protein